jgi:WD40 repeat protein
MSSSNKNKDKKRKKYYKGGKVSRPVRHFRIAILDNKEIHRSEKGIGSAEATISMKANPVDAAKKLMSSICKHQGLKKMNRLKCTAIFWIRETTRNHSKIYGPYKGKFVNLMKNGKEKIVKLKTGAVIKYSVKPVVKKYKEKINESLQKKVHIMMKGGGLYYDERPFHTIHINSIIKSIAHIPNTNNFVYSAGSNLIIFDISGTIIHRFSDISTVVCIKVFDDKIITGDVSGNIKIYDYIKKECIKTINVSKIPDRVSSIALFNSGDRIVSACDNKIEIWKTSTSIFEIRQRLMKLNRHTEGHTDIITSVDVIDNKMIVSGSYDKTIKIWNSETGACFRTLEGHTDRVTCLATIYQGIQIVSGSYDKTVKIWNSKTGECISTLEGHTGAVLCLATMVPSSGYIQIVSGSSDKTIKIWSSETGECTNTLEGHTDAVLCLACPANAYGGGNRIILSGSADKTIKMWKRKNEDNMVG